MCLFMLLDPPRALIARGPATWGPWPRKNSPLPLQLISQVVNARVAVTRLGEFLAADVQPELPLLPAAPSGEHPGTTCWAGWPVL